MTDIRFEHAPEHPVGAQPGPNDLHAWFCKRDDCDWRKIAGPGRPTVDIYRTPDDAGYVATAVTFAVCIFGVLLLLALITQGQRAMCAMHHDQLRYCPGYSAGEGTAR